jgi:crotonobetainyl-CoA:carnitine CoA-transferase CaiB-like acyl-CoA transferase
VIGMICGDFGADVIKVELSGDSPRPNRPGDAAWDRNKRSVLVDPDDDADLTWLSASISGADVCVLGPEQTIAGFGRGPARAADSNTGLVVLRLPAYLDGEPAWLGGPESNGLLAAASGAAMRQSSFSGGPIDTVSPHFLYIQALWAATCLVAALVERCSSGYGQTVTVSGMNAAMVAQVSQYSVDPHDPDLPTTIGVTGRHPTYRHFECEDGRWVASGALGARFEAQFLNAIGLGRILDDARIEGISARIFLPENLGWVTQLVESAVRRRTSRDMLGMLEDLNIPGGPVLTRDEWFDHPHVRSMGMRVDIDDRARGSVTMPGIPLTLTKSPGSIRTPSTARGEHSGCEPWAPRESMPRRGPARPGPLAGIKVLNTGTFVATPFAGMLLAELGADVVKVEPIDGDPFRVTGYTYNRGMRSLAIDLKSERGRACFRRVAAASDVVIDGLSPGTMTRLGIDYDALSDVKADIITTSLSAFGEGGALSGRRGVDMVIQAMTGMMHGWGGDNGVPIANTIAINDVASAVMTALTCVLALHHREQSGEGQRTWDSLAGTAIFLQFEDFVRFAGRAPIPTGGRDLRGVASSSSFHETSDGWIYVDLDAWPTSASGGPKADGKTRPITTPGTRSIAGMSTAETQDYFTELGIPTVRARHISEVVRDRTLRAHETFHLHRADGGGAFVLTGRHATFSRTPRIGPLVPPGPGEHTREILAAMDIDDDEIAALLDDRVIGTGAAMKRALSAQYR